MSPVVVPSSTTHRVCVIPAYQAEGTLGQVIARVREAAPNLRIVIVDDGSTDRTREIAEQWADDVISIDRNQGKGAALRAGFQHALARGGQAVVTVDADGQHDPHYIGRLLAALADADLAVGARTRRNSPMPLVRRLTNGLSSTVMTWCAGQHIPDGQSGFRAFRADILECLMEMVPGDRYEYESAFLLRAARAGYRMTFVPVPTLYPRGGVSHFRPVRDTARVAGAIGRSVVYLR